MDVERQDIVSEMISEIGKIQKDGIKSWLVQKATNTIADIGLDHKYVNNMFQKLQSITETIGDTRKRKNVTYYIKNQKVIYEKKRRRENSRPKENIAESVLQNKASKEKITPFIPIKRKVPKTIEFKKVGPRLLLPLTTMAERKTKQGLDLIRKEKSMKLMFYLIKH